MTQSSNSQTAQIDQVALRDLIDSTFSLSDIKGLCFELSVDYDNLSGENKLDKIRSLITYMHNRGKLDELVEQCRISRPNEEWDKLVIEREIEQPADGESPYIGLRHFEENEQDLFFGREKLIAEIVQALHQTRFLALVGDSGIGKTSLLRAGIIPVVKKTKSLHVEDDEFSIYDDWSTHLVTPGKDPLEEITIALSSMTTPLSDIAQIVENMKNDPKELDSFFRRLVTKGKINNHPLLILDRFEDLFTICREDKIRNAFIDNLMAAVDPELSQSNLTVVIAMRADFYAHCIRHKPLGNYIAQNQILIDPLNQEEMRQAIEMPATNNGWSLEPKLTDLIMGDAGDEPGNLPLLSHALLETWKSREGRQLTLRGYFEAGRVTGAITKTADEIFLQFNEEEQTIVRQLFLRLTEFGDIQETDEFPTPFTRRRVKRSELESSFTDITKGVKVLHKLIDDRLLTSSEGAVEIAHEALIREWPTLREWIFEAGEDLLLHRHLTRTALEWERHDRSEDELYSGKRLLDATGWADEHSGVLNKLEGEFLEASLQSHARHEKQLQMQLEDEEKRNSELSAIGEWNEALILIEELLHVLVVAYTKLALDYGSEDSLEEEVMHSTWKLITDPQVLLPNIPDSEREMKRDSINHSHQASTVPGKFLLSNISAENLKKLTLRELWKLSSQYIVELSNFLSEAKHLEHSDLEDFQWIFENRYSFEDIFWSSRTPEDSIVDTMREILFRTLRQRAIVIQNIRNRIEQMKSDESAIKQYDEQLISSTPPEE